jgi:acetyl/propionyl-CoA carboxylase alpha subunit
MSGVVVEVRVHIGSIVKKGDPIAVLSAMYVPPANMFNYLQENGDGHFGTPWGQD